MKLKKKGGELQQIDIEEVSVVDAPANRRKFLFLKSDLEKADADIRIQSDGTLEGTTITVNGEEVEDLKNFYFSYYKPANDEELYIDPVSCSYTVTSDAEDGFQASRTYNLAKAGEKTMNYAGLVEFIKNVTDKQVTEAQLQKLEKESLDSLNILSQYEGQMPKDLAGAVGHFLKDLAGEPAPEPKPGDKTDDPDDKLKAIREAVASISALLDGKKPEQTTDSEAVLEKLKDITARIGKLEAGEKPDGESEDEDSDLTKILEALKGIEERLQVVEKSAGVMKQADDPGAGAGSDVVDNFPSIPL